MTRHEGSRNTRVAVIASHFKLVSPFSTSYVHVHEHEHEFENDYAHEYV
jgi:hypothetical protein